MGACASKPEGCVGRSFYSKHKRRRKRRSRIKLSKTFSGKIMIDSSSPRHDLEDDGKSYLNPTYRASLDEMWFDSNPVLEPEWEDDFYSIHEDMNSSDSTLSSSIPSPTHAAAAATTTTTTLMPMDVWTTNTTAAHHLTDDEDDDDDDVYSHTTDHFTSHSNVIRSTNIEEAIKNFSISVSGQHHEHEKLSTSEYLECCNPSNITPLADAQSSISPSPSDSDANVNNQHLQSQSRRIQINNPIMAMKTSVLVVRLCSHAEANNNNTNFRSSAAGGVDGDDPAGLFDRSMLRGSNCLPRLYKGMPNSTTGGDRRRSLSPSPPGTVKKATLKMLSFTLRDHESATPSLVSPRAPMRRPLAGTQIPSCPLEKRMSDCWSRIDPSTFRVRAATFLRDKRKEFAPRHAAFYPFGVDVFLSQNKINHIARFVELPPFTSSLDIPPILVVNIQLPLYPASLFQNEYDGEGANIVLYFKLSERFSKDLPHHFQENVKRLIIGDELEKDNNFHNETVATFRERLKILGRVVNLEDLNLGKAENKLLNAYNEKPVLSRPQHQFFLGDNYFEIDLDVHRFSYISRKGLDTIRDRLKNCTLDLGLTIQGNKPEDLPEHVLCGIRLNEIDCTNYRQLAI